ncbi:thioredoxin family protein [Acetobacter sp.]|uniref:thioredoxin family protein n=1 Tax=Acetobacter sp. TaxID=440 RepID=UPI0039EC1821
MTLSAFSRFSKHPAPLAKKGLFAAAVLSFAFAAPLAHAQTPVPQVGGLNVKAVAQPYDTPDAAAKTVEEAFATARKTGRKVLLDFGANWCPDCRVLSGVLDDPAIAPWVKENFVVASVNVDHFNHNMDIAKKYGITIKAIPVALVVTPEGKVLNPDATLELGNARTMSAQAVVDKLNEWLKRS